MYIYIYVNSYRSEDLTIDRSISCYIGTHRFLAGGFQAAQYPSMKDGKFDHMSGFLALRHTGLAGSVVVSGYWGYIGIMEKKMETIIVYWGGNYWCGR